MKAAEQTTIDGWWATGDDPTGRLKVWMARAKAAVASMPELNRESCMPDMLNLRV